MISILRREMPAPCVGSFLGLQALDVITTILGLRLGAQESSIFLAKLLEMGPLAGLLISKVFALILVSAAFAFKRDRVVVFLNYWFALVVTWNLVITLILMFGV
jgi:hypothetical protein